MRDLSKGFYNKINGRFKNILYESNQLLFVTKKESDVFLEMDYSRVFYDINFKIYKRNSKTRGVFDIDSEDFNVFDKDRKKPITFSVYNLKNPVSLSEEQCKKLLIDSFGKLYKRSTS